MHLLKKYIAELKETGAVPPGMEDYIRDDDPKNPMFCSRNMADVASRASEHEVDATYWSGHPYFKNIFHIVSFDPKTAKWHVTLRIPCTQNMNQEFYKGGFLRWLIVLKGHDPSSTISTWQSIVMDFSWAQHNGLKHALGAFLGQVVFFIVSNEFIISMQVQC